ncbi:MAG: efflux RND transporter periplasmic adaptor subunit [Rubrivivax sp.]|jgi:multidrug efflux system membrane fusion protein|nr:efflux RND transporter periplasmic adaptor subunit [Rubrivivax sp.]
MRDFSPLATLLPVLVLVTTMVACTGQPPPPEPVRAVRTMRVEPGTAGGSHEFAAEIRARTETRLSFRVAGKLLSRSAELGQQVKAGQVLAQLDATDLRLGQEAALAAQRAAQSSYDLAAAEFKRYQDLREQGFISALELERRQSALQAQKSQWEQANAQAAVQGNQAGYSRLTATAAGVITAVEAEPGAVLAAGAPVLRLAHDGPRDAVFSVPEDGAQALRALLGRSGAVQVRLWGGSSVLPATVREISAAADATTRTFLVKADVRGPALQLGQTATVVVDLPRREGVTRLPLSAVMQQQGQTAVWLLDRNSMTVKVQPIVVGGADGNTVVVAAGLSPGQTVVTAGVHTLTPGQKVKLYQGPDNQGTPDVSASAPAPAPGPGTASSAASRP